MTLLEALVEKKMVQQSDVSAIRKEMSVPNSSLEDILVRRGVRPEDILAVRHASRASRESQYSLRGAQICS